MNKVAAFALRRKNSILSMSEKMFCPPQPLRFWITPACAGKSRRKTTDRFCSRDHPRVCGEKGHGSELRGRQVGSPPRVRGKAVFPARQHRTAGITPACAGKRRLASPGKKSHGDHPRVCGEKWHRRARPVVSLGSPPRVRGKVQQQYDNIQKERITPAYAGKRAMEEADEKVNKDHPRVCGEKPQGRMFWNETRGSPPRMRGKVSAGKILLHDGGITPACAGKRGQNAKKRYQK